MISTSKNHLFTIFFNAISTKSLMPSSGSSSDGCLDNLKKREKDHDFFCKLNFYPDFYNFTPL